MSALNTRIVLGGAAVDLMAFDPAVELIVERGKNHGEKPLAVASVNLDHIKHFGTNGPWAKILTDSEAGLRPRAGLRGQVNWLSLLDGAPLVTQARRLTGEKWPRLAGSDLIGPLLGEAVEREVRVGFLGGSPETHGLLKRQMRETRPDLVVAGWWAPPRAALSDSIASTAIAREIANARVDILVVGLGKPRQELWIAEYGSLTGAGALLAFGAVVDFLAGRVVRAPHWVSEHGMEWAWRFALEPKRLARRYLIDGPPAYARVRFERPLIVQQPWAS
ncbi:WecB/TagA/CpsF family glycosyltransferase [Arthrobacter sp. E3]|uniref:WecB/TagA/CpsF family glycosyltransferase n=1 Tax=Arthrobacter sp. E3 TaxID=517402 RepID=UPI001FFCE972|nr:WecB/TagA/CpsF family glycosyltransferase [Arthrobacter sp. E3]